MECFKCFHYTVMSCLSDKEFRETETRMSLASRFPPDQWSAAQEYFKEEDLSKS